MTSPPPTVDWPALVAVLDEVLELLRRPDLDLTWSSYLDQDAALAELGALRQRAAERDPTVVDDLQVHVTPTGPLQEAALSSGWGDRFVALANEFDRATGAAS